MQLIGMLDSPYVRRVAVSLQWLGLDFEHRPISVFRGVDEFRAINPVIKAPTLICDDGTVLMDSTLILEYLEAVAAPRTLMPSEPIAVSRALHLIGLALAACEKSVQIVYERGLRPPEKFHQPWVDRVTGQLIEALTGMEAAVVRSPMALTEAGLGQAGLTAAVAWCFLQSALPGLVPPARFPALAALSAAAETLPAFRAAPHGDCRYPCAG